MKFRIPSSLMVCTFALVARSSDSIFNNNSASTLVGAVDPKREVKFEEVNAIGTKGGRGGAKGSSSSEDDGDDIGGEDDGVKPTVPKPPAADTNPKPYKKKNLDEEIEIIVRYKDDIGKEEIKLAATKGDLDSDFPEFSVATVKVKRRDLGNIIHNPHVESCEESEPVYALGWEDKHQPDDLSSLYASFEDYHPELGSTSSTSSNLRGGNNSTRHHRRLAEDTPYGISMVQANHQTFLSTRPRSTAIKVCVVDTGFDVNHEDLPPRNGGQTVRGHSPYNGQSWNVDGHGHGTHCAGTIGAAGFNGEGVTSCNPDPTRFSFYIGKGLTNSGSGTTAGVLGAVNACAANGAKVISMSLGGGGYSSSTNAVYENLYNRGILVIAAAGNDGNSGKAYPASYPTVMSVGAVNSGWNRVGFSQYNDQVEITAPGQSVLSTLPGNRYAAWSGTSMATPHVAGVAALVWSYFPECSNNQIRNVLIKTARDRGNSGCDDFYGWGVVQAKDAYDLLDRLGCEGAGGVDFNRKSDGAPGGCEQGDSNGPPPPPPPVEPPSCANNEEHILITFTTDEYPQENTWEILDRDGDVVRRLNNNLNPSTTYIFMDECRRKNEICTFRIVDSFGDGICCGFGAGRYKVAKDGETIDEGGEFGGEKLVEVCPGGGNPPQTDAPTAAPVDPPPPDNGCRNNEDKIKITVRTDKYPQENSWKIYNEDHDVVLEGDNQSLNAETTHVLMDECYPRDSICTFDILDSYGDGLCCQYGEGYYEVEKNDRIVGQGNQFENFARVHFCDNTGPPPLPDDPDEPDDPGPCPNPNEVEFKIELLTDKYPGETSWLLFDDFNNNGDAVGVEASNGPYEDKEVLHTETYCIPTDTCLFYIKDEENDGICCGQYGNGNYKLYREGQLVATSNGQYGPGEIQNICGGDVPDLPDDPTESPTRSPTTGPTNSPPFECNGDDEMIVQFSVTCDQRPGETTWSLKDWQTSQTLGQGGPYEERGESDEQQFCVKRDGCYVFSFNDSGRDGLDRGNFGQRYDLSIANGNVLVENGGQFDGSLSEYTLFGTCTSTS